MNSTSKSRSTRAMTRGLLRRAVAASVVAVGGILSGAADVQAQAAPAAQEATRPNIVMIVADDLGYGDLGCYGGRGVPTPNIDALAQQGMRFTSTYVMAPVCAPSRAAYHTGRYPQWAGIEGGQESVRKEEFAKMPTIWSTLSDAGYHQAHMGKWHTAVKSGSAALGPKDRGFDHSFGFNSGMWNYTQTRPKGGFWGSGYLTRNGERVPLKEDDYLTDMLTDESVKFIQSAPEDKPYLLYLAHHAPHTPLQATAKYLDRIPKVEGDHYGDPSNYASPEGRIRTYRAMVSALDDSVGRVVKAVKDSGEADNTIIIFFSDNGATRPKESGGSNAPLFNFKQGLYEGGIRVPMIVSWPGVVKAGSTFDEPVCSMDLFPTFLDVLNHEDKVTTPLDGKSILPILKGESDKSPHKQLFWRWPTAGRWSGSSWTPSHGYGAMREGDWKLYLPHKGEPELYNLAQDIGEKKNLADADRDRVQAMKAEWEAWNATLPTIEPPAKAEKE